MKVSLHEVERIADEVLASAMPRGVVLRCELEERSDWTGEPMLQLDLTLDENRQNEVNSDHLFAILSGMTEALERLGDDRRVHVGMVTGPRLVPA